MEGDESVLEILFLLLPDSKVHMKMMEKAMAKEFLEMSTKEQRANSKYLSLCGKTSLVSERREMSLSFRQYYTKIS